MPGVWRKTLVYLGLAEEDDDFDGYEYDEYDHDRPTERRAPRQDAEPDPPARRGAVVRSISGPATQIHRIEPRGFNDAQEIGDRFREGQTVIVNLEATDPDVSRRVMDFAYGLVYGLRGTVEPVGKVVILAPRGVEISSGEGRRFLEQTGFFA